MLPVQHEAKGEESSLAQRPRLMSIGKCQLGLLLHTGSYPDISSSATGERQPPPWEKNTRPSESPWVLAGWQRYQTQTCAGLPAHEPTRSPGILPGSSSPLRYSQLVEHHVVHVHFLASWARQSTGRTYAKAHLSHLSSARPTPNKPVLQYSTAATPTARAQIAVSQRRRATTLPIDCDLERNILALACNAF